MGHLQTGHRSDQMLNPAAAEAANEQLYLGQKHLVPNVIVVVQMDDTDWGM